MGGIAVYLYPYFDEPGFCGGLRNNQPNAKLTMQILLFPENNRMQPIARLTLLILPSSQDDLLLVVSIMQCFVEVCWT